MNFKKLKKGIKSKRIDAASTINIPLQYMFFLGSDKLDQYIAIDMTKTSLVNLKIFNPIARSVIKSREINFNSLKTQASPSTVQSHGN